MGCAQRLAPPGVAGDRGSAPLRRRGPGRCRPRALARPEPADVRGDRQDGGEVRRGRPGRPSRRRRVPDARRVRVVQRGGAGAHCPAVTSTRSPSLTATPPSPWDAAYAVPPSRAPRGGRSASRWTTAVVSASLAAGALLGCRARPRPSEDPFLATRAPVARLDSLLQRSEEHTSELQSPCNLVCRLLLVKKKKPQLHHDHVKHVLTDV